MDEHGSDAPEGAVINPAEELAVTTLRLPLDLTNTGMPLEFTIRGHGVDDRRSRARIIFERRPLKIDMYGVMTSW